MYNLESFAGIEISEALLVKLVENIENLLSVLKLPWKGWSWEPFMSHPIRDRETREEAEEKGKVLLVIIDELKMKLKKYQEERARREAIKGEAKALSANLNTVILCVNN